MRNWRPIKKIGAFLSDKCMQIEMGEWVTGAKLDMGRAEPGPKPDPRNVPAPSIAKAMDGAGQEGWSGNQITPKRIGCPGP